MEFGKIRFKLLSPMEWLDFLCPFIGGGVLEKKTVEETGDKFTAGVVDTGDKFTTDVIDTSDKFIAGVKNKGKNRWVIYHRCS